LIAPGVVAAPELLNGNDHVLDENAQLVLIVEDNPDVVHYIGSCLNNTYRLSVALNGAEGIEKAIELIPDLIVSDVMMPEKNGYELCDTLKADIRTSHIPIILLTAKADIESRLEGFEQGADAYLSKPFNEKELLLRIDRMIKLRESLRTRYQSMEVGSPSENPGMQKEDEFILRFRDTLLDNLDQPDFGVAEISQALHLSRTQVHKKLVALTGNSASANMRTIRIQEAIKLFKENPQLNISEVAYAVGFSDPKYFSRLFKAEIGQTPSEWLQSDTKKA
jgi:response regulator RpfG family c-di-GMP phosphodiesterase